MEGSSRKSRRAHAQTRIQSVPMYQDRLLLALAEQLKTPLLHILHSAQLGQNDKLFLREKALAYIQTAATTGLSLIDNYLLSAAAQHGQTQLLLQPLNVSPLLNAAMADLEA